MFENLTERLERSFKLLKGEGKITEINMAETLKDVRRALLDADVSYKVAKGFCDQVKEMAMGQEVLKSVRPGQMMTKIVHDRLVDLMGGDAAGINIKGNPGVVLISGLQGSGKTTFSAKLALHLKKKKGIRPLLVAADVYRPAAMEQLKILGQQVGADVYIESGSMDPVQISINARDKAKNEGYGVIIVDTAGRLAIDQAMMQEITAIKKALNPSETLFVVDSMTGQDAVETARTFHEQLNFDGVVLTKLDGDTRGGAALSIRAVVSKPIKFVSTGEKMEALDVFYPARIADRILGMGDIVSLVEKAQEQFDEEESKKLRKKLAQDSFNFNDFLSQIRQVKKMGKDADIDNDAFKGIEAIIASMTPQERDNPALLNGSRRKRIATGSGTSITQVNHLIKQFDDTRKMMKKLGTGGGASLANALRKGGIR